ncbi:MAG: M20/M25/M40 family metallo-hydrolase [Clostridia bacterium]|nr:M20/M25/M40 family metallo-hydrolase [Clostridia bacterium]
MDKNTLFKTIDSLTDSYLEFLSDIAKIESPTNNKAGVDKVLEYIFEKAEKAGFKTDICRQNVSGNAGTVTFNEKAVGKPLCFSGHMDTVHPLGTINLNPVKIEGDKLYGPGVYDCKGGIVASFMAMEALKLLGYTARPIKLILQSDEENSSLFSDKQTVKYMAEQAKGCVAFLNAEPYVSGYVSTERKGIIRYEFTISGVAAHSAKCFDGANAITEASHKIIKLEQFKDPDGITVNCGIINGGTVANTVPDTCTFTADIRFKTQVQLEQIKEIVKDVNDQITVKGTSSSYKVASFRTAMEKNDENVKLLERVNSIFAKHSLPTLTARCGAGGSDAADMASYKIPTLDSLGVRGKNMHSLNEFTYISSIPECAKMLALIAMEI